jgi:hypothetical protein
MTQPASDDKRFVVELQPTKHGRLECTLECTDFRVRRSANAGEHGRAANLLKEMYSKKGYSTEGLVGMPRRENAVVLDAHNGAGVVATVTVRLDSREGGLLADTLYRREINAFRSAGAKVCEVSKLAVDPRFGSKELMASLFQLAYLYGVIHRATDVFIEVNPRHAGFYKRMLGFNEIGTLRLCPRVNAPAVLLQVELDYMRRQIALHGGSGAMTMEKSLYPYFMACEAEASIDRAMRARARREH